MQFSHSRVETFQQCPYKWKLRYLDKLKTIPDDKPDNALYLGTALHTGLETGSVEEAVKQYYSNYSIITDDHINEAVKLEVMIPKAIAIAPEGRNEVRINTHDFVGFMDLLVPIEYKGGIQIFDLYDFKYSNNVQNYTDSDQLHIYKYFFEKQNPFCQIRDMYFLMVPKSKCKRIKGEDLGEYRKRLLLDLSTLEPQIVPIKYDPNYVIRFLLQAKEVLEADEYPQRRSFLCNYCEYKDFCQKGIDYMILPENKRRSLNKATKKVVWVYGAPFSGKTTFANAFPDPLMLNTDGNIKFVDAPFIPIRDEVTREGRMTKRKFAWEVFIDAVTELEAKQNDFKTIVVDLLEDVYAFCREWVLDQHGWDHESDDSFRAWDMVQTEFLTVLKRLMAMDYDNIILISHTDMSKDITKKGGDKITAIKPAIRDKIANKVAGMVDIVARAVADEGVHILDFRRNEVIFGGGRLTVKEQQIPLDYKAFCGLYDEVNHDLKPVPAEDPKPVEKPVEKVEAEVVPVAPIPDPVPADPIAAENPPENAETPKPRTRTRRRRAE